MVARSAFLPRPPTTTGGDKKLNAWVRDTFYTSCSTAPQSNTTGGRGGGFFYLHN